MTPALLLAVLLCGGGDDDARPDPTDWHPVPGVVYTAARQQPREVIDVWPCTVIWRHPAEDRTYHCGMTTWRRWVSGR